MVDSTLQLIPFYLAHASDGERLFCINYMNSNGELTSTRFTYTSRGRISHAFFQQITGSRSSKCEPIFNKSGRLIQRLHTFNDGQSAKERFEFDPSGRILSESYSDSTGHEGESQFIYDTSGRAASLRGQLYKGWFSGDIDFTFDAAGRRLAGRIKMPDGLGGTIEYSYRGPTLVRETWTIGVWNQTLQFVYETASGPGS